MRTKGLPLFSVQVVTVLVSVILSVALGQNDQNQVGERVGQPTLPKEASLERLYTILSLGNFAVERGELEGLTDLTAEQVQVVEVSQLEGYDAFEVEVAVSEYRAEINSLRDLLSENQVLREVLDKNFFSIGDVVGMEVLASGNVILYVLSLEFGRDPGDGGMIGGMGVETGGAMTGGMAIPFDSLYPKFPWPPPRPSAFIEIVGRPESFLRTSDNLGDVDQKLRAALEAAGYVKTRYYAVPDGFALVTRLEQINDDGTPKEGEERWIAEVQPVSVFELFEWVRAVIEGIPGRFRVVVFVVSPHPMPEGDAVVSQEEAMDWIENGGLEQLPPPIAERPYIESYETIALIYEFYQPYIHAEVEFQDPSVLEGQLHLEKAGIWSPLDQ